MWQSEQGNMSKSVGSASFERPIDLVHLARQTLGDRSLEQEILALYLKQSQTLLTSIEQCANARQRSEYAHTLKGSSRAVGAWQVATAAEAVEAGPSADDRSIAALRTCVLAACRTIAELQHPN